MKKEIKDNKLERENYALRHQISVRDKETKQLKAEAEIKDAQIQSASMFISYMAACFQENDNNEVVINQKELYKFATGYDTAWKKDDEAGTIVIQIIRKE